MQRHEVAPRQQAVQGAGPLEPEVVLPGGIEAFALRVQQVQPEPTGPRRDPQAHPPEPDQPEGLARHGVAHEGRRLLLPEEPVPGPAVRLDQPPGQAHQQRHGQLRGRVGDRAGVARPAADAGDRDAERRGRLHVHPLIGVPGGDRDPLQARVRGQQLRVQREVADREEVVAAAERGGGLVPGQHSVRLDDLHVTDLGQHRHALGADRLRDPAWAGRGHFPFRRRLDRKRAFLGKRSC